MWLYTPIVVALNHKCGPALSKFVRFQVFARAQVTAIAACCGPLDAILTLAIRDAVARVAMSNS
jgi:hypothetical protein